MSQIDPPQPSHTTVRTVLVYDGVSHHEPGGMTTREVIKVIQNISVEIIGADIVEYNPMRDLNNMTAMVGYKLVKEFVAKMV